MEGERSEVRSVLVFSFSSLHYIQAFVLAMIIFSLDESAQSSPPAARHHFYTTAAAFVVLPASVRVISRLTLL